MLQRTFAFEFRLTIKVGMPRLVRVKMRLRNISVSKETPFFVFILFCQKHLVPSTKNRYL